MSNHKKNKRGRRSVFRRQTLPGAVPGTLETDPSAPCPTIHAIGYSPEKVEEREITEISDLSAFLEDWPMTWVNVDGLGDSSTLLALAEIFQIHKLALEDVVHVHQRSKVDEYENHLFIVARMASVLNDGLETEQLSVFLGDGYIVTFQERQGDCLEPVRERIRKGKGRIRSSGADYLAYAILDAVVDAWFPVLEDYGEVLQKLEDSIMEKPDKQTVSSIHRVKRDLLEMRRTVWPTRETINSLMRENDFIQAETHLYLRDCYDHVIQILDMVESYRDMASGLMEFYLSALSNRMNEIMKVLTIIATIFIPLTFIAGIYGMNFDPAASPWNMPELEWRFGYPAVWLLMVVIGIGMIFFFRKLGWFGSPEIKKDDDL